MSPQALEQRLIDLETRLTYQEEAIRSLSDTVAAQRSEIEQLDRRYRHLLARLSEQGDGLPKNTPAEEVPPHY